MQQNEKEKLKRTQKEFRIHRAIIQHKNKSFPQILTTHAGKGRDDTHAHFLSEMGYEAGTTDILWWHKLFGGMEVKTDIGKQESPQITFERHMIEAGGLYIIVRSVKEAMDYWESLGFRRYSYAVQEPDLRSDEEKKRDAMNLYRPIS